MSAANPLRAIEQTVLERSKEERLDLADPGARQALRELVDDEVARWRHDHARGHRPFDLPDPTGIAERAERNLTGYGPLEPLLADDDVWEIMLNAPDQIFVKRHRGPSGYHDEVFHDDDHVVRTLTRILDRSGTSHRKLDPATGLQDAQLEDGARLHIVHRDLSRGGHLMANIRKFTGVAFRRLAELADRGTITPQLAAFLAACARARLTVVFAGPPGSGKTTLLSCTAAELDPGLRVVVAEEVFEADIPLANVASMQTRALRADRPAVDLRRLVAGFLRMAPDVAVVGEVRDREALPLLLTLSSGVQGFTTIHAGSARQALARLRFVAQLADVAIPLPALNQLVCDSVDVVVHSARGADGPVVTEVIAVEEQLSGPSSAHFTATALFATEPGGTSARWTGERPTRIAPALAGVGFDIAEDAAGNGTGVRS